PSSEVTTALPGYFSRYSRICLAMDASDRDLLPFHSRSCCRGARLSPPLGSYTPPLAVYHQYRMSITETRGERTGSARIASCTSLVQLSETSTLRPFSFSHSATVSSQKRTNSAGPVNSSPVWKITFGQSPSTSRQWRMYLRCRSRRIGCDRS